MVKLWQLGFLCLLIWEVLWETEFHSRSFLGIFCFYMLKFKTVSSFSNVFFLIFIPLLTIWVSCTRVHCNNICYNSFSRSCWPKASLIIPVSVSLHLVFLMFVSLWISGNLLMVYALVLSSSCNCFGSYICIDSYLAKGSVDRNSSAGIYNNFLCC